MRPSLHIAIGTALSLLAGTAHAQSSKWVDYGGMWGRICKTLPFCDRGVELVADIGKAIVTTLLPVLGAAAIASLAYGGIKMILANGDESGVTEAKKIIMTTLIGSFIAIASIGIMQYFYSLIDRTT